MSFGISLQTPASARALGGADALSFAIERAREAEAAGVDDIWLNQGLDLDGITVAALVAREVPRVIVGIAAVPMYPRHPVTLASQAKAAQLAAGSTPGPPRSGASLSPRTCRGSRRERASISPNSSTTDSAVRCPLCTPPEPSRIVEVAPATRAIITGGELPATPGFRWCSANQ